MFHDMFVHKSAPRRAQGTKNEIGTRFPKPHSLANEICTIPVCFTICLFISPDLDGHRTPKMKHWPVTKVECMGNVSRYGNRQLRNK